MSAEYNTPDFRFLTGMYAAADPYLQAADPETCIECMWSADKSHKTGWTVFHFAQKLVAREDRFSNERVHRLLNTAYVALNSRPLCPAMRAQLPGLNRCLFDLRGKKPYRLGAAAAMPVAAAPAAGAAAAAGAGAEAATGAVAVAALTAGMAALALGGAIPQTAAAVKAAAPYVFLRGIDLLVASYLHIDPQVSDDVHQLLRQSKGVVDNTVQQRLAAAGTNYGEVFRSLDLNGIDLRAPLDRRGRQQPSEKLKGIVACFPKLERLNLTNCNLAPIDATTIALNCNHLETLTISGNRGLGLESFVVLSQLTTLTWDGSGVLAGDLQPIPTLTTLSLRGTAHQGDAGFAGEPNLTQGAMAVFARCFPLLQTLDLGNSATLSAEALAGLDALKHLQRLVITDCPNISAEEVATLRAAHPKLVIEAGT